MGILALFTISFHIYLIFSSLVPNLISRPLHVALALPWVFIFSDKKSTVSNIIGYIILICALFSSFYIVLNYELLEEQYGALEGGFQYFVAISLLIAVLEMARRSVKLALPLTALIALAYGFFGHLVPGEFGHQQMPIESFLGTLVITEGGIYGSLTGVSVSVIAVFIILGAFVGVGEGGNAFMAMSIKLAGRLRGGAAKVSVLASAFFGSISGSASANVASTGAFTIPTMKKLNYPSSLAGAVEAVASTGGQIMPPLMGAGAFIMAELLSVPYTKIMSSAFFPALLFFFTVWVGINLFAKRYNLVSMKKEQIPSLKHVLTLSPFFIIPFGVLLFALLVLHKTPQFSAALAIFLSAFLLLFDVKWKWDFKIFLEKFLASAILASRQIALIASVIVCAGIIIGVLNVTGVGVKITSAILDYSQGELFVALFLTALACLVLGMEVPTTAAYIICVSVCAPILQDFGLQALQAHLFIFWFALLSTITPPVCGTVFIASGIAEVNWLSVAKKSMILGVGLYFIPLTFILNPYLIKPHVNLLLSFFSFVKIALGLSLLSYSLVSEKKGVFVRVLFVVVSLFMMLIPFYM